MANPMQSRTLQQIRQSVGRALADVVISEATSTVDATSLIDTYGLQGGDDDFNGCQVMIYDAAGSIIDGEKSFVSDYASSTHDATVAPAFSAAITDGDKYEMWKAFRVEDVNQAINDAITEVSKDALIDKQLLTEFTQADKYEYNCLTGFVAVNKVEYAAGDTTSINACDVVWDELVDTDVTASLDEDFYAEGNGSVKLVVAAGCAAGDILATDAITSTDISGCDKVAIWIYSTVALDAGDLQLLLDNTASCASPVESLNIPATSANTPTWHIISLANPLSDTAVISVGMKMIVDKGAFSLWVDGIQALNSTKVQWNILNPGLWSIVKGSTNYLKLSQGGLSVTGPNCELRITGYQVPDLLSADTDTSDVDPGWLVNKVVGELLLNHAKSSSLDIKDRKGLSDRRLEMAEKTRGKVRTNLAPNTRWC
jgi:hypothetical protein